MEHLLLKATTTAATDEGIFEAVISSSTVDRERDIVSAAGMVTALQKWTATGKKIPLAWNHSGDAAKQIGYIDPASARAVGDEVWAKGWIDRSTPVGTDAWRLVKMGVLGFSFGYLTLKASPRRGGGKNLEEFDVFEITATPTPMNNDTRVVSWKSLPDTADQWDQAVAVEREAEADRLPDVPEPPPEPPPVALPPPPEPPDAKAQRRKATQFEREIQERHLPPVPAAVAESGPEPEPEPEPPTPPDTKTQRRKAWRVARDERRRREEQSIPDIPPPAPEPKPKAKTKRRGKQVGGMRPPMQPPAPTTPSNDSGDGDNDAEAVRMLQSMMGQAQEYLDAEPDPDDADIMSQIVDLLAILTAEEADEAEDEGATPAPTTGKTARPTAKALRRQAEDINIQQADNPAVDQTHAMLRIPHEEMDGLAAGDLKAVWSTAFVNGLPDSAFLYVEDGGTKDSDGRTVPRSLRHFPYKDDSGAVDLPHLRNALARIPQAQFLSQTQKDTLTAKAQRILANQKSVDSDDDERTLPEQKSTVDETDRDRTTVRAVDPLRRQADAVALEFLSDGASRRKPPAHKSAPKPEPTLTLNELRDRTRTEILIALSGVDEP
jgi:HK97 family phage prohead protease